MARFRNDFGEGRVVPTLGFQLVEAGATVTVPDEEWPHWVAGGWTALDPDPAAASAAAAPAPAAPAAAGKSAAAAAAPEGADAA